MECMVLGERVSSAGPSWEGDHTWGPAHMSLQTLPVSFLHDPAAYSYYAVVTNLSSEHNHLLSVLVNLWTWERSWGALRGHHLLHLHPDHECMRTGVYPHSYL